MANSMYYFNLLSRPYFIRNKMHIFKFDVVATKNNMALLHQVNTALIMPKVRHPCYHPNMNPPLVVNESGRLVCATNDRVPKSTLIIHSGVEESYDSLRGAVHVVLTAYKSQLTAMKG